MSITGIPSVVLAQNAAKKLSISRRATRMFSQVDGMKQESNTLLLFSKRHYRVEGVIPEPKPPHYMLNPADRVPLNLALLACLALTLFFSTS